MRQVPYSIIGSGRMARHFARYLTLLSIPYSTWSRKANTPQELETLNADRILVLISDSAIPLFLEEYPFLKEKTLIHFSGCLTLPSIHSAHPLMTFNLAEYDLATYQKVPFVLSDAGPEFSELLPGIPNASYRIPEHLRNYYHTLCVMSGNFTAILWKKLFKEFESQLHLPQEVAYPYMQKIAENLATYPEHALTGPLVRNDENIIKMHLECLSQDKFQKIYQAFLEVFREEKL